MSQGRMAMLTVRVVVLGVLLVPIGATGGREAHGQGEAAVQTLVRGVQHREGSIRTIRGYLVEARYGFGSAGGSTVFEVEFVIGDGTMRYTACAVVNGVNHWGVLPGVTGPLVTFPKPRQTVQGELPRVQVSENGQVRLTYDNLLAALQRKPQEAAPLAVSREPFCEALLLGALGKNWGEVLATALGGAEGDGVTLVWDEGARAAYRCDVVSFRFAGGGDPPWRGKLWVSEELGHAVVRTESWQTGVEAAGMTRAVIREGLNFQEVAEGVWLPTETLRYYYRYDLGLEQPCTEIRRYLFYGLAVNTPLADDDLRINVPFGARVANELEGELPVAWLECARAAVELKGAARPLPDPSFGGQ